MYKVLLVLASAAALKRPERALKKRGGELGLNSETAIQVGTWITGLSGAMAYVDPKGNLENYGITTAQTSGIDNMRWAGANQLTLAAIFAADPEQAVGLSGYYAAWNLIASAPATRSAHMRWKARDATWRGTTDVQAQAAARFSSFANHQRPTTPGTKWPTVLRK